MKIKIRNILLLLVTANLHHQVNAQSKVDDNVQQARLLVTTFANELKSELSSAMLAAGPINGLEVCKLRAEPIAREVTGSSAWHVARTSSKVRNLNNTPEPWELNILQQFEKRLAEGEDINKLEYSGMQVVKGEMVFRYVKAIPTGGVCLACHGRNVDSAVSQKITELYPNDQATGFSLGDIRGVFSLSKTVDN